MGWGTVLGQNTLQIAFQGDDAVVEPADLAGELVKLIPLPGDRLVEILDNAVLVSDTALHFAIAFFRCRRVRHVGSRCQLAGLR